MVGKVPGEVDREALATPIDVASGEPIAVLDTILKGIPVGIENELYVIGSFAIIVAEEPFKVPVVAELDLLASPICVCDFPKG